tara:strand:- start:2708 stop:2887 length:180 start_codon:yes stop_codon:yes gene_type:complete
MSFKRMVCDDDDSKMVLKVRKEKMRKILESVRRRERMMSKAVLHYISDRFAMTTMMITK